MASPGAEHALLHFSTAASLPSKGVVLDIFDEKKISQYCFSMALSDLATIAKVGQNSAVLPSDFNI